MKTEYITINDLLANMELLAERTPLNDKTADICEYTSALIEVLSIDYYYVIELLQKLQQTLNDDDVSQRSIAKFLDSIDDIKICR